MNDRNDKILQELSITCKQNISNITAH